MQHQAGTAAANEDDDVHTIIALWLRVCCDFRNQMRDCGHGVPEALPLRVVLKTRNGEEPNYYDCSQFCAGWGFCLVALPLPDCR
jgi:hypothetical protein